MQEDDNVGAAHSTSGICGGNGRTSRCGTTKTKGFQPKYRPQPNFLVAMGVSLPL